jgi:lysophospholipase
MKYLLLALISLSAFAIPEKDYDLVWKREVLAPLEATPAQEFTNHLGKKVRFRSYIRGEGLPNIVVSPGRQEPMKKYFELVHDIPDANFYLIDHLGQGESDRLLPDRQKGHIGHFSDYVKDFTYFMEKHVLSETKGEKLYLIAHSMGGAIATRFMDSHPDTFDRVVLSAPMYDIYTKPYPGAFARALAKILFKAGRGNSYAPGRGPYDPEIDVVGKNEFSHSEARIEMNKYLFVEQDLGIGGPTVSWVNQSFIGTKGIQNVGKKLSMPIMLLQAELDVVVKPKKHLTFCMAAQDCELISMKGAYHEILQEKDVIRDLALKLIRDHFDL